jgi:hypothetical protein
MSNDRIRIDMLTRSVRLMQKEQQMGHHPTVLRTSGGTLRIEPAGRDVLDDAVPRQ